MSGSLGSCSGPDPAISTRALIGPAEVRSRQRRAAGSQRASSTSQPKRTCGTIPCSAATRLM